MNRSWDLIESHYSLSFPSPARKCVNRNRQGCRCAIKGMDRYQTDHLQPLPATSDPSHEQVSVIRRSSSAQSKFWEITSCCFLNNGWLLSLHGSNEVFVILIFIPLDGISGREEWMITLKNSGCNKRGAETWIQSPAIFNPFVYASHALDSSNQWRWCHAPDNDLVGEISFETANNDDSRNKGREGEEKLQKESTDLGLRAQFSPSKAEKR